MMNQYDLILGYIEEHGSITPMEAYLELGITKLATRISEMIRRGIKISKKSITVINRRGQKCRVMQYGKAA